MSVSRRSFLTGLSVGALAVAGLIGAHTFDYFLLVRDPVYRGHVLAQTGHATMPQLGGIALLSAFAIVVINWALGFADGVRERVRVPRFLGLFTLLGTAQVLGFVALEAIERTTAGVPLHHLMSPLLPVGILLQIAVAAGGALLLVSLRKLGAVVARAIARRRIRPRAPRRTWSSTRRAERVVAQFVLTSAAARAPPSPTI